MGCGGELNTPNYRDTHGLGRGTSGETHVIGGGERHPNLLFGSQSTEKQQHKGTNYNYEANTHPRHTLNSLNVETALEIESTLNQSNP